MLSFFKKPRLEVPKDMAWTIGRDGRYYEYGVDHWLGVLLKRLKKPVFYDVGANFGYYSVKYAGLCRAVYAFEPVKETYEYLYRNVSASKRKNIYPMNYGLSSCDKEVEINIYSSSGCNSLYKRNIPADHELQFIRAEKICLKVLDEVIKNEGLAQPTLIKIDVEGAEKEVLEGSKSLLNEAIFLFEYSDETSGDAGYQKDELIDIFDEGRNVIFGFPEDESDIRLVSYEDFSKERVANVLVIPKKFGELV